MRNLEIEQPRLRRTILIQNLNWGGLMTLIRGLLLYLMVWLVSPLALGERPPSPFAISGTVEIHEGAPLVRFSFELPPEHVIYAERLKFETEDGKTIVPSQMADPVMAKDKASGHEKKLYDHTFTVELKLDALPIGLIVKLQGCSNSACYFPEKHRFKATLDGVREETRLTTTVRVADQFQSQPAQNWRQHLEGFKVTARGAGYVNSGDFLSFLDRAESGHGPTDNALVRYQELGLIATIFLIVIGGAGLNLTPCVLPLIPINLAIIGAGAQSRSRRSGCMLGTAYGAGMALVYGTLGLIVVLTGSKFGTLNSSAGFNFVIALVFVALALGMFDLLKIDFSRFQSGRGRMKFGQKNQVIVALSLGAVAALLAGACVAPVVISVLLLSTRLYGQGVMAGLLLPFLLGLGMASPWPFAGAGLTFLPKPGKWMVWVKYAFGLVILVFASYYAHLGYHLRQGQHRTTDLASAPAGGIEPPSAANDALTNALREAQKNGQPVLIDFAASWCKNCLAMDETVFNKAQVQQRLRRFVVVKYEAERPNESPAKEVLDHFEVIGLPTYLVLKPPRSGL